MTVELIYFKPHSGKYYAHGSYQTKLTSLSEIWSEVASLRMNGKLPGIAESSSMQEFIVSVAVPDHPDNHPKLIVYP
jgi:hypothetical protein